MKWYMVMPQCSYGMGHPYSISEVYEERRILPVGTIIPESFKGRADIENLYLPASQLMEVEPTPHDLTLLYMLWPQTRPRGYQVEAQDTGYIAPHLFYQIEAPNARGLSSIPWGVSALMDVEGICQAGDMALCGDVVPGAFFTGLNNEQFEQIQRMGAIHLEWLNRYTGSQRAEYMRILARPVIRRYMPTKAEKEALFSKYPALAPVVQVAAEEIPESPKRKIKRGVSSNANL